MRERERERERRGGEREGEERETEIDREGERGRGRDRETYRQTQTHSSTIVRATGPVFLSNICLYILPSSFPQLEIVHRLDPFNSRRWEPLALGADYRIPKARSQPAIVKTTLPLSLLDDPEYVDISCVSIIVYPLFTLYAPL